jgi:hypothetical protein
MNAKEFIQKKNIVTDYVEGFTGRNGFIHIPLENLLTEYAECLQLLQSRVVGECVIHSTDWHGKCFKCHKQVFTRKDD